MPHTREMLATHPRSPNGKVDALTSCIEACFDCAQTCTSCADACLGEQDVASVVKCIRLNLDCADVCDTTGRLVSRRTEVDVGTVRAQLQACIEACRVCGEECEKHAGHMEHCRVCAEACRACKQACEALLGSFSA